MRSNICSLPLPAASLTLLPSCRTTPSPCSTTPHKYPETALRYFQRKIWKSCTFALRNLGYRDAAYCTHTHLHIFRPQFSCNTTVSNENCGTVAVVLVTHILFSKSEGENKKQGEISDERKGNESIFGAITSIFIPMP